RRQRRRRRLRLQLVALILVALLASAAHADNRFDLGVSYFGESSSPQKLHVARPHVNVDFDAHPALSFKVGYDADIVSGATPRTYGGSMDAISSATNFSDVRHAVHAGTEIRI